MLDILVVPFLACLVLTGILCYFGIHVIMREVIFVDLALAQIAAMGAAVGAWMGMDPHSSQAYVCSLAFTLVGAAVFTLGRFRDARIPQEAIIGIVYAVSSAIVFLILSKIAVGKEEIDDMLVGRLLFVKWPEVSKTALICLAVGVLHVLLRRRFFAISTSYHEARKSGTRVYLWDFIFYGSFGVVVTSSVRMAGVLLVFSYLVVPTVCAMMFCTRVSWRLGAGWAFGLLASLGGLAASAYWDFPTGAAIVTTFGFLLVACAVVYVVFAGRFRVASHP